MKPETLKELKKIAAYRKFTSLQQIKKVQDVKGRIRWVARSKSAPKTAINKSIVEKLQKKASISSTKSRLPKGIYFQGSKTRQASTAITDNYHDGSTMDTLVRNRQRNLEERGETESIEETRQVIQQRLAEFEYERKQNPETDFNEFVIEAVDGESP